MSERYLGREDAPIEARTWELLDAAMVDAAKSVLAGRRLLHIEGPYGLGLKAVPLEDCQVNECMAVSQFVPVHLISTTFTLGIRDLLAFEQNGLPFSAAAAAEAAIECARTEDTLIFEGAAGSKGLLTMEDCGMLKLSSWNTVGKAADDVIQAMILLDEAGYHGPYSLALAPSRYNLLFRRYLQGQSTELEHIRAIVTDGVYKAPSLRSGGVLLASGKRYASIVLGQDMTVGFVGPIGDSLEFSITESLALLVREPSSICVLKDKE
ncbi:MAG TPA: family 1 encapsulin nanocompartment shell protein [Methanolinea sp.]|nr:family 1 encapsulin nanocompartment shell protein [Methanolinea sp.]